MLVLAIETATHHSSVVVTDGERELAAWREVTRQDLCQRLAAEVGRALLSAGCEFSDLQLVAVGLGPGSFTSVRIGMATAKGIALARGIPLVGIPSLMAMTWQARAHVSGLVCPVTDAKRGELYTALYQVQRDDVEQVEKESVATASDLMARLSSHRVPVTIVGERAALADEDVARFGDMMWREAVWPDAADVADLGARRYNQTGGDAVGPLRPIYVRMSYAEESRKLDLGLR
jgi:tRNA threonylcarbamoyladenosine biosynthesis protein TsaB